MLMAAFLLIIKVGVCVWGGTQKKTITRNNKVWDIIIIKKYNLVIKVKLKEGNVIFNDALNTWLDVW